MIRSVRLLLVCLLLSPFVVEQAAAQRSSRAPASPSEYDNVLREALVEFERGNWVEARALFERAHELRPSARTLRAIGFAAFEQKLYVLALTTLSAALEDPRKPLSDNQRREAQEAMQRAKSFIARYTLELSPADASVRVDSGEPVIVDGQLLLDPGEHEIVLTAEGFETTQRRIHANPLDDGRLSVVLRSNAEVAAAAAAASVVEEPTTQPVVTTAEPEQDDAHGGLSTQQYVGIGVAGLGVASLGASLYFALHAKSLYDESGCANGGCADAAAERLNDDALVAGNIATGLSIGGLVVAITGVALLLWSPSPASSAETTAFRLAPTITSAQLGLTAQGAF